MLNDCQNNIHFSARPRYKKPLKKVSDAVQLTLSGVESPNKMIHSGFEQPNSYVRDLNSKLAYIRTFMKRVLAEDGIVGYFIEQIGLVKRFRIAHCNEYAEITKTALKANGIKNADVYNLYVQSNSGKIRQIDHAVTAIGVKPSRKSALKPFVPRSGVQIIDSYYDGFCGKISDARKMYCDQQLIQPNETLMLAKIPTIEPNQEALNEVKKAFPTLVIR